MSGCTGKQGSGGNIGCIYMVSAHDRATAIPVPAQGELRGLFLLFFFCLFIRSTFIKWSHLIVLFEVCVYAVTHLYCTFLFDFVLFFGMFGLPQLG